VFIIFAIIGLCQCIIVADTSDLRIVPRRYICDFLNVGGEEVSFEL